MFSSIKRTSEFSVCKVMLQLNNGVCTTQELLSVWNKLWSYIKQKNRLFNLN